VAHSESALLADDPKGPNPRRRRRQHRRRKCLGGNCSAKVIGLQPRGIHDVALSSRFSLPFASRERWVSRQLPYCRQHVVEPDWREDLTK
jgi:hypothetical protein